ncbi:hypothetical protein DYBT9275_04034 [Dyadobacter sp. CECT 9275]|uniref:MG2 domain-containing protein n=1 Tax=Dyadobacter helix TaxID=2822344 RepID=A0A916NDD2_9BACT|nr:hypothetical protein [Dyadobacter sp. CECT 9275]CAG5007385.1 hypothetical protein DYBT9275_04034 [Dyadobacter sp. CECT 9275]
MIDHIYTMIPLKHKGNLFQLLFLLVAVSASGQDSWMKSTGDRFQLFAKRAVQEKIYLHTDRTFYVVGETMWFKAYNVEAGTNSFLDLSKVAYLEVLDKENNAVAQTKFSMLEGKGNGSLIIPSTIASGMYKVRCYTNWMKNFDVGYFFEMPVSVVNPFVRFDPDPDSKKEVSYDVQFFPEGGQMVRNVAGKVAFRAVGTDGKGIAFSGAVINRSNDTIVRFSPSKYGIGYFMFRPEEGEEYKAVIRNANGKSFTYPLPTIAQEGYVMAVKDSAANLLSISVTGKPGSENRKNLYLVTHTRQSNVQVQKLSLEGNKAIFALDKNLLGDGISHITVLDENHRPLCERLYFKYPTNFLAVAGKVAKPEFMSREMVTLDLSANVASVPANGANLSVAIYLADSIKMPGQQDISSYLWLSSDLRGKVESPESYFDGTSKTASADMDNLMLTHGWRRFKWENVLAGNDEYPHLPEHHGHFIYAKLTDTRTGEAAAGIDTYLAAPDAPSRLYVTQSNTKGEVRFEVKDFFGPKEITLQTNLREDSTYKFELLNPFSRQFSEKTSPDFLFDKTLENELLKRTINMQTGNVFLPKPYAQGKAEMADSMAFFGKPDERYFLDDFTRFPTMEEVLREYVRGVLVRRRHKEFHFRMIDKLVPNMFYNTDPLVLLDGIPVFNIDKIMEFDPLKIKKIELMNAKYFLGTMSFTGITSFSTYQNDLAGFELDPRVLVTPYDGIQATREFYSPKYDSKTALGSRIPDFRNLLYWQPNVTLDETGKAQLQFYTSDQTGRYKVVVQGITPAGNTGSHTFTFDVGKRGL